MTLNYDLHSHSTASDGTLTPTELILRAVDKKVDVLAITDHDCINGLAEAQKAAYQNQIKLINGAELSSLWNGLTLHITALDIDPQNITLQKLLNDTLEFRKWRGEEIGKKLERAGVTDAGAKTLELVKDGAVTRGHYAQLLLNLGLVKNFQAAFDKYLGKGKRAYVAGQWADINTVVSTIHAAGGLACVAHPKRYKTTNSKLNKLFADFKECGGDAIEVINANSTPNDIKYLAQCAENHQLMASRGSDFHTPCKWIELGRLQALPESCQPVWDKFK